MVNAFEIYSIRTNVDILAKQALHLVSFPESILVVQNSSLTP